MARTDQMKLGFILHGIGTNWADWRHPETKLNASTDFELFKYQAQLAEAGKFDFLFVSDSLAVTDKSSPHDLNRFEPITILSALSAVTKHIGLVGTLSVSYSEPFNVARQFASLDHISGGRAAWNVVTSWLDASAENYSNAPHPPHDVRYRIAAEYLDVVRGLWDSWEDGAIVGDKASGRFVDPDRLHTLNHHGEFFNVKGPLNISRPPQGHPVIFQAGASEDGKNFASRHADAIFVNPDRLEAAIEFYADLKKRAVGFGRRASDVKIMLSCRPVIGRTDEEAEAKYQELCQLVSIDSALKVLGRPFNDHDFSVYDLDAPFPAEAAAAAGMGSNQSVSLRILNGAKQDGLTLRETALRAATPRGHFVGGPEKVADALTTWFQANGADGYVIFAPLPGQLELLVELVVPLLQARGVYRRDYDATTLRGLLELPEAVNRYTAARQENLAAKQA
ncbi:MAG TPA: LLM class flavin-dependent oxidoreductase [Caulobacterales bacterium]|nr:LLM class flavin-dependent oxidoreductase [Caulobacterales bacterium]